jgi:hypothetical protein
MSKEVANQVVIFVFALVVSLPSRYRSIRCCRIGSMNGGWLLDVGFAWAHLGFVWLDNANLW